MATEVVKRILNVDEYYKMAEVGILKSEDRVELINGEIYQMSPIGSRHAAIVDHLAVVLKELFERNIIVRVQNPIRIDNTNEPQPDISLLKYRSDYYSSSHPGPADVLTIMEIAGSSLKFDQEVKAPLYATYDIQEYWIIDIENNEIQVFSNPKDGNYSEIQKYETDRIISLMGKSLPVKDIII